MSYDVPIYKSLKLLGVPANLKGYRYLAKALTMELENPGSTYRMTKYMYPEIARACDTTASGVERCIRHAIEVVFDHTDAAVLHDYFGNAPDMSGKLTNTQFIAAVAEHIRVEGGEF